MPETRLWAVALIGSLAVNLFVAGYLASALTSDDRDEMDRARWTAPAVVQRILDAHDAAIRGNLEELRAAGRVVNAALVADPYDADRFQVALSDLRAQSATYQFEVHSALAEAVGAMNLEQRSALADASRRFPGYIPR